MVMSGSNNDISVYDIDVDDFRHEDRVITLSRRKNETIPGRSVICQF